MKAIEYLEEQKFCYDHFTKLTSTGINPDNDSIAQFAEDYHQAKLNLLTIPDVSTTVTAKTLKCPKCKGHCLMTYIDGKECTSCGYVC